MQFLKRKRKLKHDQFSVIYKRVKDNERKQEITGVDHVWNLSLEADVLWPSLNCEQFFFSKQRNKRSQFSENDKILLKT